VKRTITGLLAGFLLIVPTTAAAQVIDILPPCPWWDCDGSNEVVVEEYLVDTTIENSVATTRVTQVLRNDGRGLAEGDFLYPIPADAAVTGLTLWIDGEPVAGELLDGDAARQTYEEIVRRTLDPALLEFVDDGLLRLAVFPIPAGETRRVEIEYRQVLSSDGGLVRYRHPLAREHSNAEVELVVARIEIIEQDGLKTVYSPTHSVAVERLDEESAVIGFEGTGLQDSDLTLYYSTDAEAVSIDVVSYRDGHEGWFLLLASPGLAGDETVVPKDVALVLDVSGSMEGEKLAQAQDAARFVLQNLNADDRFEVLAFSTGVDRFGGGLSPATDANAAADWVTRLSAAGATDIHGALSATFDLTTPGRPLYVIFLTDGLPTEGLVDTSDILESLERQKSERTSVFAFGVGFDVDTILLDSIAQDHHGTSQYVVPGEDINEAVTALYSKVSSPVLTGVDLAVDGVIISDLYPALMPDIFSGEQLVVAGRYDGWGPATVSLTGRIRGEHVTIEYDDVRFSAAGGDDTVPSLWATRKIGDLLRDIRLNGPDAETIDQIVRISIRHGIVTPYTSYLVTEPAPFGDDAIDVISRGAADSMTTFAPSGEASVGAADAASELSDADRFAAPQTEYRDVVTTAGGRTMRQVEGVWIDTTYDPAMEVVRVAFASDDYFKLAASSSAIADALAIGQLVIVVLDGTAYEIVDIEAEADDLPTTVTSSTSTTPTTTPLVFGAGPEGDTDGGLSSAAIALMAALGAAATLAVLAARKN
jgi:Ca-activated chloride channel family protein